jgi:hypothetical protein
VKLEKPRSFGARKDLRSVFALWGRVPYSFPSGTPTSPQEKRDQMSKWNKAEWDNNCCEGCFQPLRDCLCDDQVGCGACGEMISVEDQDENGFHDPEFCGANEEVKEEKSNRFKKMMGAEINCWTWNFHSALDYVSTLVTSGKVVLTSETDLEKIAKGFDTTDHNGEDIFGLFHLFLMFTASKLDLDSLGVEEVYLSEHGLTEDDLVQMFEGNPVFVARLLREAQAEFQPTYSTREAN